MKIGLAKEICKLQGINIDVEIKAICPYCDMKMARMNINKGSWECIQCGKDGRLDELLRLAQEIWLDGHPLGKYGTQNNKSVKGI